MGLHWQFSEKGGTITVEDNNGKSYTANWYEGNALMIVLNEYEEDGKEWWTMGWFFADIDHAKNCLGLNKGYTNMWTDNGEKFKEVTINRKNCRQWKKLVDILVKAFPEIEIKLF